MKKLLNKPPVIWQPHAGSQRKFLSCPANECLLHGNRGGGKSDVLLMDYLQGVGVGYGQEYRGILFRQAYTELTDIKAKSKKWIPQIFPGAKFNSSEYKWAFPDGEELLLRYIRVEDDYWAYHGHEYPWIGWEELTNWPVPTMYLKMMSCNRSSNPNIPRRYRSNCNPSGPGHQWVKDRFITRVPAGKIYVDKFGQTRAHVKSSLDENMTILKADPAYKEKLKSMTEDNPVLREAWVHGSWNLISGGFFSSSWRPDVHVIPKFQLNSNWNVIRSFDWGSTKPWAVTYIAECNGEEAEGGIWYPKGTAIVIAEIYGWTGTANEGDEATSQQIAERVLAVDNAIQIEYGIKVKPGPADTQIWTVIDGKSIGSNMATHGLRWTRAYKGKGSRVSGWSLIRQMLGAAVRQNLESPHLYFFDDVYHHIRTLPIMQRDKLKQEDIDTSLEDHLMDSLRYGLARKLCNMKRKKVNV